MNFDFEISRADCFLISVSRVVLCSFLLHFRCAYLYCFWSHVAAGSGQAVDGKGTDGQLRDGGVATTDKQALNISCSVVLSENLATYKD